MFSTVALFLTDLILESQGPLKLFGSFRLVYPQNCEFEICNWKMIFLTIRPLILESRGPLKCLLVVNLTTNY
jgi:hypothetical protein